MVRLYQEIARSFEENAIPDAAFDARCIIEQVAGKPLECVQALSADQETVANDMARRRIAGEPLQYILGEWEFFGMRLFVGEGVLIPRPDTERLVEIVLDWCRGFENPRIIDLCTGSGCIALALQKMLPGSDVHALDVSPAALSFAKRNVQYHALPVTLHQADVLKAPDFGTFDVIVSNPPYLTDAEMQALQPEIRFEPASALEAGVDGLRFYAGITALWKDALRPGGLLAFEIGEQQGAAVAGILRQNGFIGIEVLQDYAHHDRVVVGLRSDCPGNDTPIC